MSINVAADRLHTFVSELFAGAGLDAKAAGAVAENLIEADLMGLHSHGVMLAEMYLRRLLAGSVSVNAEPIVVSDSAATMVLDAGHGIGVLSGDVAMAHAVTKAEEFGAGVVSVRHAFHFGTARRFSLAAAASDCIGITMCNTRPLMPAPGGAERVVGNNPIAVAIPTSDPVPLVLDMATSEAAMGKIRMAAKAGTSIPANWATAADGTPTNDPAVAIEGMLLPSAGPKGFGLALVIDLMCGLLSGGAIGEAVRPLYGDVEEPYDCTHLFIAISLSRFGDAAEMKQRAAAAAVAIRGGARAPGTERLYTPGEPEWSRRQAAASQLSLQPEVVRNLLAMAETLRVPRPSFFDDFERTSS